MIRRTFDPVEVNGLLNKQEVRETIGGEGSLDVTDLLADSKNICLIASGGGAFFRWTGPGVYEGHSFFTARGREAITLGKQMLSALEADMVWGATPVELRHARLFNRKLGFKSLGPIQMEYGPCELFVMRF